MRIFVTACVAAIVLAVVGAIVLDHVQDQRSLLDRERAAMIASDELVANTGVGVSRRIRASYPWPKINCCCDSGWRSAHHRC
jgi:hypothetical protein